jgi:hypothetical protein
MTAYLLDTNIWLRSVQREAPHHPIADVFTHWRQLVSAYRVIGRRVHDARLVAAMLTHGVTHLLTFNRDDFRQFAMITVVTPTDLLASPEVSSS